ncbi:hypothetical protein JAAARDRAFT_489730 [Jaapia argillacea MUCL 33604]|uniref:Uncharacterized protein n=1 Tax=Jaapia argillacea MUCL 33604 TaxID=933084 RepID=A0A067PP28_9AGAM|nr:hypothetical protein JAAARDRAFT_489730 [Jaapia argillacea MUCL 33604]
MIDTCLATPSIPQALINSPSPPDRSLVGPTIAPLSPPRPPQFRASIKSGCLHHLCPTSINPRGSNETETFDYMRKVHSRPPGETECPFLFGTWRWP